MKKYLSSSFFQNGSESDSFFLILATINSFTPTSKESFSSLQTSKKGTGAGGGVNERREFLWIK